MKKTTKLSAFTLIELLIVIAIIGILAGLMSGAIANVMAGANATKVGNNGRNILNALMQTNQDREAAALGNLWAKKNGGRIGGKNGESYSPDSDTSNKYLAILFKGGYLSGISLPDFAGGGVEAASDAADLEGGNGNLWNVLAGVDKCQSYAPAFWSRNLDGVLETDFDSDAATDPEGENWTETKLDSENQGLTPFQKDLVVVIRKGGAMQVIKSKQLNAYTFFGGETNSQNYVKIMKAGTADISTQN